MSKHKVEDRPKEAKKKSQMKQASKAAINNDSESRGMKMIGTLHRRHK